MIKVKRGEYTFTFNDGVSKEDRLAAIDKYMENETGCKVGKGWEKVAKEYKHRTRYNSALELAFNTGV